jgi:hypothetical protein
MRFCENLRENLRNLRENQSAGKKTNPRENQQ